MRSPISFLARRNHQPCRRYRVSNDFCHPAALESRKSVKTESLALYTSTVQALTFCVHLQSSIPLLQLFFGSHFFLTMARVPRSIPKRRGPYYAQPTAQSALYEAPPRAQLQRPLPPPPTSKAGPVRTRGLAIAGTFGFGIALYLSSLYVSFSRTSAEGVNHSPLVQKDVSAVYDDTASSFDAEVGFSEWLGGITKARKHLAKLCKGHVLEVSAGTGRNLGYYKFAKNDGEEGVKSLTLVDLSKQMVDQAKVKWDVLGKGQKRTLVRFMQGDAAAKMPEPPVIAKTVNKNKEVTVDMKEGGGKSGYDTIVQTMGLCSTPSPVQLLKNLAGHLDSENDEASILLLEHGRSYYQWLNRVLDTHAPQHADKHGCWWNRDIGEIVEESGLEIVSERRKHFGTTWIFELKPKRDMRKLKEQIEEKIEAVKDQTQEKVEEMKTSAVGTKPGTSSWFSRWA